MMKLTQVSTTFDEPVTLPQLRQHLTLETNEFDSYLTRLISTSRELAEQYINGIIADRQFRVTLDCFTSTIELPINPIDTSSISISYVDTSGNTQSQATFATDGDFFKTTIKPAYNENWPSTEPGYDKVTITFTAGCLGNLGYMPDGVKHAVLMIAGTAFDQRENHTTHVKLHTVPMSSELLLNSYKRVVL